MHRLGSDRVIEAGGGMIVISAVDMRDWEVREFRRIAIMFQGRRYFLTHKAKERGRFRYRLVPWSDEWEDIAGGVVEIGLAHLG